jgi:hypothetical protein
MTGTRGPYTGRKPDAQDGARRWNRESAVHCGAKLKTVEIALCDRVNARSSPHGDDLGCSTPLLPRRKCAALVAGVSGKPSPELMRSDFLLRHSHGRNEPYRDSNLLLLFPA